MESYPFPFSYSRQEHNEDAPWLNRWPQELAIHSAYDIEAMMALLEENRVRRFAAELTMSCWGEREILISTLLVRKGIRRTATQRKSARRAQKTICLLLAEALERLPDFPSEQHYQLRSSVDVVTALYRGARGIVAYTDFLSADGEGNFVDLRTELL